MRLLLLSLLTLASAVQAVGPAASNERKTPEPVTTTAVTYQAGPHALNVIVPVFDANIPADPDHFEKKGIWPELRNMEANRFAVLLRDSLEDSQAFGAVRVTPDDTAIGELYVTGKILESTSEIIRLQISLQDISAKKWATRKFKYRVREYDLQTIRKEGDYPYKPIFAEITAWVIDQHEKLSSKRRKKLHELSTMVLARSYSADTFDSYFAKTNGVLKLKQLPAEDDPHFQRVLKVRAREELFIDELQKHYRNYLAKTGDSYDSWQEQSFPEAKEYRLAKRRAKAQMALAALAVGAAVALASNSDADSRGEKSSGDRAKDVGAVAGGVGAVALAFNAFKTRQESRIHRQQLGEYGRNIDIELGPVNVDFEGQTKELTGNAAQQFQEIREFLQQVYAEEATPDVQL